MSNEFFDYDNTNNTNEKEKSKTARTERFTVTPLNGETKKQAPANNANAKAAAKKTGGGGGDRIIFWAVAVLVFLAVVYFSFDWALDALVHARAEVAVPDITKKSLSNGLDLLASANLAMKKAGDENAPDIPAGYIIRQLPGAGSTVREGRVIRVWVSAGKETMQMPSLIGMTLSNAQLALRQAGLTPGAVKAAYSVTTAKGSVTSQSFPEGSPINKGDIVDLTVSNGAPEASMLLMPDFRQRMLTDATNWASQNNITVNTVDDPNSLFPNGTVTAQNPPRDSQINSGDAVTLTVSRRNVAGEAKTHHIQYELPQGKSDVRVRIVVIDQTGEREVFNQNKAPGSKIDLDIPYGGEATVRIYVNDILVRERDMK